MNKTDKETLLDLYMTLKELTEEVESILKMEASAEIYERARLGWIGDLKYALGNIDDTNTFIPSFLTTLRELNLVDNQNVLVSNFEDDDDDDSLDEEEDGTDRVIMTKKEQSNDNSVSDEEDDDGDGAPEWQDEIVFAVDGNKIGGFRTNIQNRELVKGEEINSSPGFRLVPKNRPLGPVFRDDGKPSINDTVEHPKRILEPTGLERWMVGRVPHRVGGPAITFANGSKYWYHYGKLHREDGPAIEDSNGTKTWFRFGKKHRDDGPAEEKANGDRAWFRHGLPHRLDGPYLIKNDGYREWAFRGVIFESESAWEAAKGSSSEKLEEDSNKRRNLPLIYGSYVSSN